MKKIIEATGAKTIEALKFFIGYLGFTATLIRACFNPRFFYPAVRLVFRRQIYFTGVQILPTFTFISIAMGLAIVGGLTNFMVQFGAQDAVGGVLVSITIKELAPILTAMLLTLRSSTAVTAEIALMKMNREIETLKSLSIDPYIYLYAPRILSGVLCLSALSVIFVYVAIIGSYLILSFNLNISFDFLISTIFDAITIETVLIFIIKILLAGYFVMSIPIYSALQVGNAVTEIPISLLKGMFRLFYALIFVEIIGVLL